MNVRKHAAVDPVVAAVETDVITRPRHHALEKLVLGGEVPALSDEPLDIGRHRKDHRASDAYGQCPVTKVEAHRHAGAVVPCEHANGRGADNDRNRDHHGEEAPEHGGPSPEESLELLPGLGGQLIGDGTVRGRKYKVSGATALDAGDENRRIG